MGERAPLTIETIKGRDKESGPEHLHHPVVLMGISTTVPCPWCIRACAGIFGMRFALSRAVGADVPVRAWFLCGWTIPT